MYGRVSMLFLKSSGNSFFSSSMLNNNSLLYCKSVVFATRLTKVSLSSGSIKYLNALIIILMLDEADNL